MTIDSLPPSLARNSSARPLGRDQDRRRSRGAHRQGRDRPGHHLGPGADRGGRAGRRLRPHPHDPSRYRPQPERGRYRRQPVDHGRRRRAATSLRRGTRCFPARPRRYGSTPASTSCLCAMAPSTGRASNESATYWELSDEVDLSRDADGRAAPKRADQLTLVGKSLPRLDLPDKVIGPASTCTTSSCPACCTAASCGRRLIARCFRPSTASTSRRCRACGPSCAMGASSASSPSARSRPSPRWRRWRSTHVWNEACGPARCRCLARATCDRGRRKR